MNGLAAWVLVCATPAGAVADDPLSAAIACYEELDYTCADTRLAEALAGELTGERRARAHLYEALLAVAWRDRIRARRAVRALLAIAPAFDPGPVPPSLQTLFDEERPDPPAPPAIAARLDGTVLPVFGQDAEQWTEGLGLAASGGVLFDRTWLVEATFAYTDFAPAVFSLEGMVMLHGMVGGGWRATIGPIALQLGLSLGAARIAVDGTLVEDTYWAAAVAAPIDISWPIWSGVGVGIRIEPLLLTTTTGDQAAVSYILPLSAGLRFVEEPP